MEGFKKEKITIHLQSTKYFVAIEIKIQQS